MMLKAFKKWRFKKAKKYDAERITRLFSSINQDVAENDVMDWIKKKEVFVLKDKKKIKAAFSYAVFGIAGLFGIMYIRKLAVSKDMRGKGVGSYMISNIKQVAKKTGALLFFLFSLEKAMTFYEKNKLKRFWRFFWWKQQENQNK